MKRYIVCVAGGAGWPFSVCSFFPLLNTSRLPSRWLSTTEMRTASSWRPFPGHLDFFAQGQSHEEARANLEDVIEGNVRLVLQLGWDIPTIPGVAIEERDVEARPA